MYSTIGRTKTRDSRRTQRLKDKLRSSEKDIKALKSYKNPDSQIRKLTENTIRKAEKTKINLLKSQYRDKINAGSSRVTRILNKITGSDKYEAELLYDLDKRSKVNRAWSD